MGIAGLSGFVVSHLLVPWFTNCVSDCSCVPAMSHDDNGNVKPSAKTADDSRKLCCIVGESVTNKSRLLSGFFPNLPRTCLEHHVGDAPSDIVVDGKTVQLLVRNVSNGPSYAEYDRLRPLSYPGTAVFLVCFSVVEPWTCLFILSHSLHVVSLSFLTYLCHS